MSRRKVNTGKYEQKGRKQENMSRREGNRKI